MGKTANRNISFFKNASRAVPILQRQIYNILRRSKQCNISYINIYIYSIYIYLYFKINVGNSIIDISHIQYVLRKRRIILLEKKKKKEEKKKDLFRVSGKILIRRDEFWSFQICDSIAMIIFNTFACPNKYVRVGMFKKFRL